MPGITDEQMADVLCALKAAGAYPRRPSCTSHRLKRWETGAIAATLQVDEPAPQYLEERLDPSAGVYPRGRF